MSSQASRLVSLKGWTKGADDTSSTTPSIAPGSSPTARYVPPSRRNVASEWTKVEPGSRFSGIRHHPIVDRSASRSARGRQHVLSDHDSGSIPYQDYADRTGMESGLGANIGRLAVVPERGAAPATITNVQGVGGYRWLNTGKGEAPMICVPGELLQSVVLTSGVPEVFVPSRHVGKVKADREIPGAMYSVDYQGTLLLAHNVSPLEPIFHALTDTDDIRGIELVVDRSVISKLLHIAGMGTVYPQDMFPFRFDAERIGDVVVIHPWDAEEDRKLRPCDTWNTAKSYHIASTREITKDWDINAEAQHMVRYTFGGLECLVRFDVQSITGAPDKDLNDADDEDLADVFDKLKVDTASDDDHASPNSGAALRVKSSGYMHAEQDSLVNVRVRKYGKDLDWNFVYAQMFFSQVPRLRIAWHLGLDFSLYPDDTHLLDGPKMSMIARDRKEDIAAVAQMLREMVRMVREKGDVSFVSKRKGDLVGFNRVEKVVQLSDKAKEILMNV